MITDKQLAEMQSQCNLPPEQILCFHTMHCGYCDKGYYSLVAGERHEARCEWDSGGD